jgi:hypothetical protein
MKRNIVFIFVFFVTAVFCNAAFAQVRVTAYVDTRQNIYMGSGFIYRIIIEGEGEAGQVDLKPLEKFSAQYAGGQNASQVSISIEGNGKETRNEVKRYIMSYSMMVAEAGQVTIPAVDVTVKGISYRTNAVSLNILKPGTTDKLDIEVVLSEQKCYVGQPVLMTINFYVSTQIGDFQIDVPTFESGLFLIEDPDLTGKQVQEYRLHTGMSVFVTQQRVVHKDKDTILISFSKVILAKEAGRIEIKPVTVSADVAVGRSRSQGVFDSFFDSQYEYQRFMVKSEPKMLEVQELPKEGRPEGFYGLVGRYKISAAAKPTDVYVGDPITLTIKIGGDFLKPVKWPALEQIPEISKDYKIPSEKATPTVDESGNLVFVQTIRAANNEVKEIPPIPLAYFDADKGKYETAKTEPIKLKVAATERLTEADLQGSTPVTAANKEIEAIQKGLSANYEGQDVLISRKFTVASGLMSPSYAAIWAMSLVAFIVSAVIRFLTRKDLEREAKRRKKRAISKAKALLKQAGRADEKRRGEIIESAVKQYIADRFERVAGSLTAEDCYRVILEATGDEQGAEKFKQIIEDCEAARFASVEVKINSAAAEEAAGLLKMIEKKSRK